MIDRFLTRIANARSLPRQAVGAGAALLVRRGAPADPAAGASASRSRNPGSRAACSPLIVALSVLIVYISKLINSWNARFFNALQDKNADAFWSELQLLGGAGRALHRRRRLSPVAAAAAHHPLAPLAERGLFPRLAGRPHLLPHGARPARAPTTPSSASSRTATPSPRRRSTIIARPAPAGHDARHLRGRALEPVGQLRAADLRRPRHPRLHDVGGASSMRWSARWPPT